jgi:hypothetical protein
MAVGMFARSSPGHDRLVVVLLVCKICPGVQLSELAKWALLHTCNVCRAVSFASAQPLAVPNDTVVIIDCHDAGLDLFSKGETVSLGANAIITFKNCFLEPVSLVDTARTELHAASFLDLVQGPSSATVVLTQSEAQVPCKV